MSNARAIGRGSWIAVRVLVLWTLVALVFWGVTALLPGFDVPSFGAGLLTTAVIAVINGGVTGRGVVADRARVRAALESRPA